MLRLTHSRRLSRRSRAVSAVIGIAAVLWMVWMFVFQNEMGPPPSPVVALPAERLSFARLADDEEIVVTTFAYHRDPTELRFRRNSAETTLIVSAILWSEVDRSWKMARVLAVRPLTAREAAGLDTVVAHLRASGLPSASDVATYEIDYRRGETSIGREKLFESELVLRRNEVHFYPSDEPDARRELEQVVARAGVAPADFLQWWTFEMLVRSTAGSETTTRE